MGLLSSKNQLPSLDNWKQGNNSNKKKPFIEIVYIQRILSFAAEEAFEAIRLSSVSRDWRDAVQNYCDEMWWVICKEIQLQPGFQHVFLKICQSDCLLWVLNCCYRQREANGMRSFLGDDATSQAMLPINFRFVMTKPALVVATNAGQPEVVKLLVELEADVTYEAIQSNLAGKSPLELAIRGFCFEPQPKHGESDVYAKAIAKLLSSGDVNTVIVEEARRYLACARILMNEGQAIKKTEPVHLIKLFDQVLEHDLKLGSHKTCEDTVFDLFLDNEEFTAKLAGVLTYTTTSGCSLLQLALNRSYIRVFEWLLKHAEKELKDQYQYLSSDPYRRRAIETTTTVEDDDEQERELESDHSPKTTTKIQPEAEFVRERLRNFINRPSDGDQQTILFPFTFDYQIPKISSALFTLLDRFPPESRMLDIYHKNRKYRNVLCHILTHWIPDNLPFLEKLLQLYGSDEKFVGAKCVPSSAATSTSQQRSASARALLVMRRSQPVGSRGPDGNRDDSDVVVTGRTALTIVCENKSCDSSVLAMLLKYCREKHDEGAVAAATQPTAQRGGIEARLLIDINSKDELSLTALQYAISNRDVAKVKLLVDAGADLSADDDAPHGIRSGDYFTGYGSENAAAVRELRDGDGNDDDESGAEGVEKEKKKDDDGSRSAKRNRPIDFAMRFAHEKEGAQIIQILKEKMKK